MLSRLPDPSEIATLLEHNQEVFQFLLAFVQMSRSLKIGFIEVNFPPDIDQVITALREHPKCASIQFAVLRFDDPDMHFLLEAIKEELLKISIEPNKKLVLILQGLEKAIAYSGDNPPILTNLNYARDAFPIAVPHPLLFALPDYAVTRFAQFAPDFWAWTSSTFRFQTLPETRDRLTAEVSNFSHNPNRYFEKNEQGERIDLLERLLQEYPEDTEASSRTRLELLNQLGKAHQSIREFDKAKFYFQQAINLSSDLDDKRSEAESLFNLGDVYFDLREFKQAHLLFEKSLNLKTQIGDRRNSAVNYHMLGMVAEALREYGEARQNYQQALAIFIEFGDHYSQASTYHQLGRVAQELREYEEARQNYQQALAIKIEFGDRYSQASTYHQLGWVAQELREYGEARQNYQQALAIKIEFGDRYSQASTYGQLGLLAEAENNFTEAGQNLLQALEIFAQFQDQHSVVIALRNLSRIYQATQDQSLLEAMAKVLGVTVDEVRQKLELT
ncbi:MAG: tetratricopeptide repeat protein [Pseudanabaenaceae cyanobacterium bins.39]|nr:tetratricopeptide repeat protein [Pseudanabaenaceae cyanobacterium bins.39]